MPTAGRRVPACCQTAGGVLTQRVRARLCRAAPPTEVGGAHNSPIANATTIISKSALVDVRIPTLSAVFYSRWHRHQAEKTCGFVCPAREDAGN